MTTSPFQFAGGRDVVLLRDLHARFPGPSHPESQARRSTTTTPLPRPGRGSRWEPTGDAFTTRAPPLGGWGQWLSSRCRWLVSGLVTVHYVRCIPPMAHSPCDQRLCLRAGGRCARRREPCGADGTLMARLWLTSSPATSAGCNPPCEQDVA